MKPRFPGADRMGLLIALAALSLRLTPWRAVFSPSGVLFVDVDDWHHLRVMLTAARNFPFLPTLDRYFAHPDGFLTSWPPLHDWLVGAAIRAGWLFKPGIETAAAVAAVVPALAGALTVFFFCRFARRAIPALGAAAAAALAGVLPAPLFYTVLGRPDHHCVETMWFALALGPLLSLVEGGGSRTALLAALALSAGWLSWNGFVAFEGVAFLWLLAESRRRPDPETRSWSWVFAAQIPLLLLFTAGNPFVRSRTFDFDLPGLFAPTLCVALALALEGARRRLRGAGLAFGLGGAVLGLVLAWLSLPSLALFAGAPPRIFHLFSELQPLLRPYGRWAPSAAEPWFGWGLWLLPVLAWDFAARRTGPAARLALVWGAVFGLLALLQARYASHFSFVFALLVGSALERAWSWGRARSRGAAAFAAACAVTTVVLGSALRNAAALPFAGPQLVGDPALREACEWIRANTPPTRSRDRDEGIPEYGVFADSNAGPMVAALAERPTTAANNHAMRGPLVWTILRFLGDDPEQARADLSGRGFRYLLLGPMNDGGLLFSYLGIAGVPPVEWEARRERLALWRLYRTGGSDPDLARAFRLVHQTPGGTFKVFSVLASRGDSRSGIITRCRNAPSCATRASWPSWPRRSASSLSWTRWGSPSWNGTTGST
ncbi:MAG: hypothetical protein HY748_10160 [Elusimicrobia bacterium]|nr:hypothetical protein [Elusimicrobiota bacterium]